MPKKKTTKSSAAFKAAASRAKQTGRAVSNADVKRASKIISRATKAGSAKKKAAAVSSRVASKKASRTGRSLSDKDLSKAKKIIGAAKRRRR
jgi:cell division protein FtsL